MISLFGRKSLSAEEAYEIAKKHNPGMIAYSCTEYEKYWVFNMNLVVASSCSCRVNKRTGKCDSVHFSVLAKQKRLNHIEGGRGGEIEL